MALTKEQKQDIIERTETGHYREIRRRFEKHRIHGSSDCVDDGTN